MNKEFFKESLKSKYEKERIVEKIEGNFFINLNEDSDDRNARKENIILYVIRFYSALSAIITTASSNNVRRPQESIPVGILSAVFASSAVCEYYFLYF